MGQGTVTNTTELSNRDINNTQEITRDQVTGMLDSSVKVDHRLLTEDGRKEIIQEQKDVVRQLGDVVEGIKDTTNAVRKGVSLVKQYEEATQNMTLAEKTALDNLIKELNKSSNINSNLISVVLEGTAIAGSTCARVPACASVVINLFGVAAAEIILNSGEEKKETHPKGVPSTSGNSATGMPPEGDDENSKIVREPNSRHNSETVKKNSVVKDNNTVVTRSVNMKEDSKLVSNGLA